MAFNAMGGVATIFAIFENSNATLRTQGPKDSTDKSLTRTLIPLFSDIVWECVCQGWFTEHGSGTCGELERASLRKYERYKYLILKYWVYRPLGCCRELGALDSDNH